MRILTINLRLSLAYVALFAGVGVHLPFFPLWLASEGLDASQRATVLAMPMFVRVLALSILIDWGLKSGTTARAILIYALAGAVLTGALPYQPNFVFRALFAILSSLAWMPVMALLDALTMGEMRAGRADYGKARLWGSVSFVALTVAGGVAIDAFGTGIIVPLLVVILLSLAVTTLVLPSEQAQAPGDTGRGSISAILAGVAGTLPLFVAGALLQGSHAVFYVQGSVHWKSLGYSETVIGGLWMVAILAEILLFSWSRRVVGRFDARALLVIAAIAAIIRWTAMAFDPPMPFLVVLQVFHAGSFACTHLATTWLIARLFSGFMAARAQGLYVSLLGAANGFTMLLAGPLYARFAGKAELAMTAIAAIALMLAATCGTRRTS